MKGNAELLLFSQVISNFLFYILQACSGGVRHVLFLAAASHLQCVHRDEALLPPSVPDRRVSVPPVHPSVHPRLPQ